MRRFVRYGFTAALSAAVIGLLAAPAGAQGNQPLGDRSPAAVASPADVQAWKAIDIGTRKGVIAYRNALDVAAVRVGDSANEILGRPAFRYVNAKEKIDLVIRSGADLGLESEAASLASVYSRARLLGLALCPAEVGLQLRLDYANQPLGEVLHIAMEPVATYAGDLTILALMNAGTGPLLIGSDGRPEFMVPRSFRFVFALPQAGQDVQAKVTRP
jgi:hypothetical protein